MKIYIRRVPGSVNVELYATGDPSARINHYMTIGADSFACFTQMETDRGAASNIKPFLILPELEAREFLSAMSNAASEEGVENKSETFVKGKLEATENHLKDMRTLLKLK